MNSGKYGKRADESSMQNNFSAAESKSGTCRILPSKKPRSELRSNDGAEHYRCAIAQGDERNGIARTTERVSGGTKTSRDDSGDGAAKLQPSRRAAPFRSAQINAASGMAEKNGMQRTQCTEDTVLAPRSIVLHAWGLSGSIIASAAAIAASKGKKTCAQCVPFSRPGRIDLTKTGAAVPITLRAKTSFNANHSR
jgi:hypothetical protein